MTKTTTMATTTTQHTRTRTHRQKLVWLVGVGWKGMKKEGKKDGGMDLRTRDEER